MRSPQPEPWSPHCISTLPPVWQPWGLSRRACVEPLRKGERRGPSLQILRRVAGRETAAMDSLPSLKAYHSFLQFPDECVGFTPHQGMQKQALDRTTSLSCSLGQAGPRLQYSMFSHQSQRPPGRMLDFPLPSPRPEYSNVTAGSCQFSILRERLQREMWPSF